jgi:hypothetical protein
MPFYPMRLLAELQNGRISIDSAWVVDQQGPFIAAYADTDDKMNTFRS